MTGTATGAVERLPSKALFMDGKVPEPLTDEQRQWLVEQLHAYPRRVNEARTCCIGALTDMATTEFCRLMAARPQPTVTGDAGEIVERVAALLYVADECESVEEARLNLDRVRGIFVMGKDAKHDGDCTKQCHTCLRCLTDDYRNNARIFLALHDEQQAATIAERDARIERLERDEFNRGYLIAVANLVHLHDEPTLAQDVLAELGEGPTTIKRLGLSEYDAKPLRKMFRELARLKANAKRRARTTLERSQP